MPAVRDVRRLLKGLSEQLRGEIHPSTSNSAEWLCTKSPLAGAAWNFSQSQARQLCNAGLSVGNSDKPRETQRKCTEKWGDFPGGGGGGGGGALPPIAIRGCAAL